MKNRYFLQSFFQSLVSTILVLSLLGIASAQVRSSPSYQLQSDSINIGGGFSSSTSYIQESTVGEVATGFSSSTAYSLYAGYQQMQEVYLSLSTTGDVAMSPDLPGLTGGTSNGSTTVTVTTDSPSGYQLTIEAENDPAMRSGANTIDNLDEGVDPDYTFSIAGGEALFGLTVDGVDIVDDFKEAAGICGSGVRTSFSCWVGPSTTPYTIAESTGANHPAGATTTVNFRVRVGSGATVPAGLYTATTTVTALPL